MENSKIDRSASFLGCKHLCTACPLSGHAFNKAMIRRVPVVESKLKKHGYFITFILPCVILYAFFFIYPFLKGISISTTNWDGLTPKTPISVSKSEFESQILQKIKKTSDKNFLMSVYTLNYETDSYSRLSVSGLERMKIERILSSAGYAPEKNRFVGLQNYIDIISGKVKDTFYPQKYTEVYYNAASSLPPRIEAKRADKEILKGASSEESALFLQHYTLSGENYVLKPEYSSYDIEELIWSISEHTEGIVSDAAIDDFVRSVNTAGLAQDENAMRTTISAFFNAESLSAVSRKTVQEASDMLFELGVFRNSLSSMWTAEKTKMGVVGFTFFFAFFSVIGINLIAFILALILDSGIPGQRILRTIFFLPNVLSMIIVALIWKMLFYQILPAVSGIDIWLSDASKAPWLLIIVATWQGCGYYMIVYLAGLQNIPPDVIEASRIDGANSLQRFRFITLPLIVPAITISLFLTIANALKSFDLIYAMVGPSGYATSTVPFVLDIYYEAFAQRQAGMATSKALLLFLVILLITGLQLYVMKKREVEQ